MRDGKKKGRHGENWEEARLSRGGKEGQNGGRRERKEGEERGKRKRRPEWEKRENRGGLAEHKGRRRK